MENQVQKQQLISQLQTIAKQNNNNDKLIESLDFLKDKILTPIQNNPNSIQFKSLNVQNELIQQKLFSLQGMDMLMNIIGFQQNGGIYCLSDNQAFNLGPLISLLDSQLNALKRGYDLSQIQGNQEVPLQGTQLKLTLINTISSNKQLRQQAEQTLNIQKQNDAFFFQKLFQFILNPQNSAQQLNLDPELQLSPEQLSYMTQLDLLTSIYLTNDIRQNYILYSQQIKASIQELILDSFQQTQNQKLKQQLIVAINRIVCTDFPDSMILRLFIQNFSEQSLQQDSITNIKTKFQLIYTMFKSIYKDLQGKDQNQKEQQLKTLYMEKYTVIQQCIDYYFQQMLQFNSSASNIDQSNQEAKGEYWNNFQQKLSNSVLDTDILKFGLKFINLGNYLQIKEVKLDVGQMVNNLTGLQVIVQNLVKLIDFNQDPDQFQPIFEVLHKYRQLIYLYHKFGIHAIKERRVNQQDCIQLMEYLKQYYLLNFDGIYLNNETCISSEKMKNSSFLQQIQEQELYVQFFEDEKSQIIQAINICKEILANLGKNALESLTIDHYAFEHVTEETTQQCSFIDQYFDDHYFEIIMDFLINKVLQLNWIQLYQIEFEPEKSFSDNFVNNNATDDFYTIRGASMALLRILHHFINEDKMLAIIDKLLQQFTQSILTDQTQYQHILIREAFYFLVFGLFYEIKNSIEFEVWYESILYTELQQNGSNLAPLRIQILNLINSYIEYSYRIPEQMCQALMTQLLELIRDKSSNLQIRLLALKNILPLITQQQRLANIQQVNIPYQELMSSVLDLSSDCQENESKKLLLQLIENLITRLRKQLTANMGPIFEFLKYQWNQVAQKQNDQESMTIKYQIAQNLKQILLRQETLHFSEFEFYYAVIENLLEDPDQLFLIEDCGLVLLHVFLIFYNKQMENQQENQMIQPQNVFIYQQLLKKILEKLPSIFLSQMSVFKTSILIFMEYTHIKQDDILELLSQTYIKGVDTYQSQIKDDIFKFIFDGIELVLIANSVQHTQVTANILCNMILQISTSLVQSQQKQQQLQQQQEDQQSVLYKKLHLIRLMGRVFFQSFEHGLKIVQSLEQSLNIQDFMYVLIADSAEFLENHKPDLCYYRYHCVLLLGYLNSLLTQNNEQDLVNMFQNINISDSNGQVSASKQNIDQKTEKCFQQLIKNYQIIQDYYNISIHQESHWITENMIALLETQIKADPSEQTENEAEQYIDKDIGQVYNNVAQLSFLKQDSLKKFNFDEEARGFFQKFKGAMPQDLQDRITQFWSQYSK